MYKITFLEIGIILELKPQWSYAIEVEKSMILFSIIPIFLELRDYVLDLLVICWCWYLSVEQLLSEMDQVSLQDEFFFIGINIILLSGHLVVNEPVVHQVGHGQSENILG